MKMNRLIPMLPVKSIGASIEFYEKLGFSVETRRDEWRWAMLVCGDDIVEYHKQVRASGLEIPDVETTFYGLTEFRIDDPDGNRLWIGESISESV